ncbi:hypothetical protein DTO166G4_6539 [Paecilomyces variotii]|nr:hypothetical protein DTO166G4_6539 [Paecilomyces variotii]KAJ9228269.1 hypothetical protein DTO166G5_8709 [Paecilomyces variotii]KAJ9248927.1 hypothetical protein DTO195F2_8674 [Paecilomyces variotii]KAJ9297451.1 hypothetical protein DTO217A2_8618 [Paecilomyces variotii]
MEHSPVRLSPVKDGRRVLGEKTPNASILSPSKNHKADTAATTAVPMKPLREALSPRVTGLSHYAGQKRTIDHVEEQTENPSSQQSLSAALPPYEEQFHIFDESSQSTVKSATMAASQSEHEQSVEQTAEQPAHPQGQQRELSQLRMSISPKQNISEADLSATSVPSDPDARKAFIQQKATLLRGRIQTAMKRVKDPQLDRRVSELEAHSRKRLRFSMPASPTKEAAASQQTASSPAKVPKLLPAPELKPTAYSARYVSDIPSSPPASAGEEPHDDMPTPTQNNPRPEPRTPAAPVQLSSPPGTANREEKTEKTDNAKEELDESQFSNYVDYMIAKRSRDGVALDGLIQLMKTTDKYDGLDMWTG